MVIVSQIVGKVAEYAVEPAIRQVGYLTHCKSKLEKLKTQANDLSATRERRELEVVAAVEKGETIHTDVQNWLDEVVEITEKANELWKPDMQAMMSCLRGVCPNPVLRYKLGKRSTKLEQAVSELYVKGNFATVSYKVRPQEVSIVSNTHYEAFDSRTSTVKKIMDELRIPNTDLILVYGIGGVGKTTLVEEVLKQAVNEKLFADAVMVRSVQKPDLEGIQKEIAKKLGMEVRDSETMSERALHLCDRVKDKKVLVILDNILESIDLQSVGLPCLPTCRILLTSRTLKLLSSEKRFQKGFELRVLNEEEAWRLFETKAGDVKNPDIRTVATDVAKKCGGLPLLVVTVASSLRNSALPVWKDALRCLKVFDNEDPAKQEAYVALEWSCNQLDDKKLKPLFLICGILVNHFGKASLTDLLKYTIGLGLFRNIDSVEDAQYALHARIEQLKDSCLLLDSEDNTSITMHDLLRDVAISIASKGHRALLRAYGDDLKEWPNNKEYSENCTMISLSCKNLPRLPEVLKCQQLEFFYLSVCGGLLEIPVNFFEEMKELKVMDLSGAHISSLPQSLHLLQNLQTLCLDHCVLGDITLVGQLSQLEILSFIYSKFKELPEEIGKLTRLRLLDLSRYSELEVISPNVISRLTSLEDLRMKNSFNRWVPEGVTGERSNASLSELKELPHLAALSIHVPDAGSILTDLFTDKLKRYQILIGTSWKWDDVDETLNTLKLKLPTGCDLDHGLEMLLKRSCEDLYLDGSEGAYNVVYRSGSEDFQQLKHLHIKNNAQFRHIITEELPSLESLKLEGCKELKGFVCDPKLEPEELYFLFDDKVGFPKLERLAISQLSILTTIWHNQLDPDSFYKLRDVNVSYCDCLISIFTPSISGRLNALGSLLISSCSRLEAVFEIEEIPDTSTTQLKISSCENLDSVRIVARGLQQLRDLHVSMCDGMEEIVSKEGGLEMMHKFVFPKATYIEFVCLKQLKSFYPGMHASEWPLLKEVVLRKCGKLDIFASEISSFQKHEFGGLYTPIKHSLFLIDKDVSFPNLGNMTLDTDMEIWCGPSTSQLFRKLKSLEFESAYSDQKVSLFENNVHPDATFPRLSVLKLKEMRKLMHLRNENFQGPGPVFPNLEVLQVVACFALKDLGSSAIPFKNLTTLEVVGCHRLKYLTTYTIAKTLKRLREMKVGDCKRMREIGATTSDGDDAGNDGEISFSQLQSLKLYHLPRVRDFFSGNCIVKFPSLKTVHIYNCPELKINRFAWRSSPELGVQITEELVRHPVYLVDSDDDDEDDESDGDSDADVADGKTTINIYKELTTLLHVFTNRCTRALLWGLNHC
ncbi:unnamed protein product [Malus baccata var. baccata]